MHKMKRLERCLYVAWNYCGFIAVSSSRLANYKRLYVLPTFTTHRVIFSVYKCDYLVKAYANAFLDSNFISLF